VAYLFTTPEQLQTMLQDIGAASVNELFDQIPPAVRLDRPLNLPPALTELDLEAEIDRQARCNASANRICFLGGGAYDHFIPAVVDEIAGRGEFYTAYTPYQPEASQGSLQAFFEYQSLICQLTGMDVSNASLYEGGTAVSEAAFMAMRVTERHSKVVVLGSVNPEYRQILATYTGNLACEVVTVPTPEGTADLDRVADAIDDRTACLVFQQPNFYGCLEEPAALAELAHRKGALAVVSFDPISLGLLQRPGQYGADIAVAEGQSLGTPLQYGGPYLGVMACRHEFVRKMPGRLVSEARDKQGRRCYVLGLQTREQHIRREKATSNICTNQGLLALRATVYLSLLGPHGMREVAELCCCKAHYAAEQLQQAGLELPFERPFFKEFVLGEAGGTGRSLQARAAQAGFEIGPALVDVDPSNAGTSRCLLMAVTERRTREQIDELMAALRTTAVSH
jgi:glycine dehydrogenase subunit 1